MNNYIVRLSNVIAWLGLVYFACVITHIAVTGIDKFYSGKLVSCNVFKQRDLSDMKVLSIAELETIIRCAQGKKSKYRESLETLSTFITWLLYQSILFIPYAILSTLNYLMVGKLRLLPWIGLMVKKDNDI